MNFLRLSFDAMRALLLTPWRVFPMALVSAYRWLVMWLCFPLVPIVAQTPVSAHKELADAYRDNGIVGILLWLLSGFAAVIVGLWWRSVKAEDAYRKELLAVTERSIEAQNKLAQAFQGNMIVLTELSHAVRSMQR